MLINCIYVGHWMEHYEFFSTIFSLIYTCYLYLRTLIIFIKAMDTWIILFFFHFELKLYFSIFLRIKTLDSSLFLNTCTVNSLVFVLGLINIGQIFVSEWVLGQDIFMSLFFEACWNPFRWKNFKYFTLFFIKQFL